MALIHCDFFSHVLGLCCSMDVILPQRPVAGEATPEPFPTLYLLHGLSDDHTIWQRRTSIERYVADLRLAVVMPAVGRSFYTDMAHGLRYWTFVSEELPAICRGLFPLSARRAQSGNPSSPRPRMSRACGRWSATRCCAISPTRSRALGSCGFTGCVTR